MIEVTQADRNAAADWYRDCMDDDTVARSIERGENDNMLVQAFARHRIAHQPQPSQDAVEPVAWMYQRDNEIEVWQTRWDNANGGYADNFVDWIETPFYAVIPDTAALMADNARLREALEWYRDQMCEGWCEGFDPKICASMLNDDCAGCKAATALKGTGQ
jgi:hypothetical protein